MAGGAVHLSSAPSRSAQYAGQGLHFYIVMVGLVASCGGLLFGYDIGISGGVSSMPEFQQKFFPSTYEKAQATAADDSDTDPYCVFDDQMLQFFSASLYLAGMLISVPAGVGTRKYGRKAAMIVASICFLIGAGLTGGAVNTAMLVCGRVMLGFGIGIGNQAVPLYLAEASPARYRGTLVMLFQLCVTVGIFTASLINYGVNESGVDNGWRISLSLAAVPAIILFIAGVLLPDTPNSLIARGHAADGKRVLAKLRGVSEEAVNVEYEDICEACEAASKTSDAASWAALFKRRHRPQLITTCLIAALQQLTGINAIMFYCPLIFATLGSGHSSSLLNTVVVNSVNLVCTFVAIYAVDKFGRRVLFLEGGLQMIVTLFTAGAVIAVEFGSSTALSSAAAAGLLVVICLYVAGFSWSWGPLGWLVPAEIQALEVRTAGMSTAVVVNFLWTFVIGQAFLSMMCAMKYGVYFFFGGWVVVATVFIYYCMPETRGVGVEEVSLLFARHPVWRKVLGSEADEMLAAADKQDAARLQRGAEAGAAQ